MATDVLLIQKLIEEHGNVGFLVDAAGHCYSMCAWTAIAAKRIEGDFAFHGVRSMVSASGPYGLINYQGLTRNPETIKTNEELERRLISKGINPSTARAMAFTDNGFIYLKFSGDALSLINQ